jgi:glutathione S-transferase
MHNTTFLTCAVLGGGAITGIGSLPHTDPTAAVQLVAELCPEIPFWPQLPQRSRGELMVEQALTPFTDLLRPRTGRYGYQLERCNRAELLRRLTNDRAVLTPEVAAGFYAFEDALAAHAFPRAVALKGQIIGPLTLAAQIVIEDQLLLHDPESLAAVSAYVERLARWQIARLARWRTPIILALDEPYLALLSGPGAHVSLMILQSLIQALRGCGVLISVHCCATLPDKSPPCALLGMTGADIVSFDAYQQCAIGCTDATVQTFVRNGGILAFGLVPTLRNLDDVALPDLLTRWIVMSSGCDSADDIVQHTMITATCGLGLLTERAAWRSFQLARDLAQAIAGVS